MKIKCIIVVLVLILPTLFGLFKKGYFGAADDMHIAWLMEMDKAVKDGQIPPRYVADLSYGYGYPLFNFIFPLPYYLGEVWHSVGLSYVDSIKAVLGVSMIFSAVTMYLLVNFLAGNLAGITAAVIYVYAPYRAVDTYVRGAVGECLVFVFLPLVIYFIVKLHRSSQRNSWGFVAGLGLSVAGMILSHNIVSYMFVPMMVLLVVILGRVNIFNKIAGIVLGLLASIYFWLPALIDSKLMKYDTVFNFFDHFPTIRQLILPYWGYGASVPGPYDGMSFFVGEANLIVIILTSVIFLINRRKIEEHNRNLWYWLVAMSVIAVVMMNHRSMLIWKYVPLLPYFQFPWRFLTLILLASSMSVIIIKNYKYSYMLMIGLIIIAVGFGVGRFRPEDYLDRNDEYYANRYIPLPEASEEYKGLMEEYLRLPKVSEKRPDSTTSRVTTDSKGKVEVELLNNLAANIKTEGSETMTIYYNKYHFPGWEGTIDGVSLSLNPGVPYGQISFDVPPGRHEIYIGYGQTVRNKILNMISILAMGSMAVLAIGDRRKGLKDNAWG